MKYAKRPSGSGMKKKLSVIWKAENMSQIMYQIKSTYNSNAESA
jgi:hypothetical protein